MLRRIPKISAQISIGICGNSMLIAIAEPPSIPPTCKIFNRVSIKVAQIAQFPFLKVGPGSFAKENINVFPVLIVFLPNSSCIATFTKQLTRITQKVINPPFAPRIVVAINSPDPTIEAERIKPGPKNLSLEKNDRGGSFVKVWIIDCAVNLNLAINNFNQVLVE